MSDVLERLITWDRCWPGNVYIQGMVDDAIAEITRLRAENKITGWCQPMKEGEPTPRVFLVRFEDTEMGDVVFTDESAARDFWRRANVDWNCYLFAAMPLGESN